MNITDLLARTGGLQSIGRELGVDEAQAASGAEALLPALLGGLQSQADQAGGLGGLGALLTQLGGGGLLDNLLGDQPTDVGRGNDVLGQIFGSKDVSREVAQNAATQSGLDPSLLRRMLPMLAMLVAGYMAKRGRAAADDASAPLPHGTDGPLGADLGGLLGGVLGSSSAGASTGGLAGMLDQNGDGNVLDDLVRLGGKALR